MNLSGPGFIPVGMGVGFMVGLTGIGGGALMTPILLFLGVDPLTAVSSDLVVSLIMKPVGSAVHLRRGTVYKRLVGWLALGSIPAAFIGVLMLRLFGNGAHLRATMKHALGVALILAVAGIAARTLIDARRSHESRPALNSTPPIRVLPTVLVGVIGGLIVGMTSVGSGSLMIVCLMLLYPQLDNPTLVGTDLAQAIPLVGSAALGHAFFGDVQFAVAGPLLVGALPAVYLGARVSSSGTYRWARPVLVGLLILSAMQLLGAPPAALGAAIAVLLAAGIIWFIRSTPRAAIVPS
jgi:uncharacterized protein